MSVWIYSQFHDDLRNFSSKEASLEEEERRETWCSRLQYQYLDNVN